MPIPGSASKINPVSGVSSAVVSTTADISTNNQKLVKGAILYNTDTGELKIADGIRPQVHCRITNIRTLMPR